MGHTDTSTTFGGLIALQNLISASTAPPSIMSISYGRCETVNRAAANAAYNSAYQQAVAAAFTPNPDTSTSTLTFPTSKGSNLGMFTVTITGASGALSPQTKLSITVHR